MKTQAKATKNPTNDTFDEFNAKEARLMTEKSVRLEQVVFWRRQIYSLIRREAADGEFSAEVPTRVPDKMKDRELTQAEVVVIVEDLRAKGFVVDQGTWLRIQW